MDIPQPILNFAENMGFNAVQWAEREHEWVILAEDGKKFIVSKDDIRLKKAKVVEKKGNHE